VAFARDLLRTAVPGRQAVGDDQRGQGERDEGGYALAWFQAERGLWADLFYRAGQHAAGVGDGVLHLAAGGDDVQDGGADLVGVGGVGLAELAVGGGVEVEAVYADADLVGSDRRAWVKLPGRLREDAWGVDHPVQAEGRGGRRGHRAGPSRLASSCLCWHE
jgi:hypothetical protein